MRRRRQSELFQALVNQAYVNMYGRFMVVLIIFAEFPTKLFIRRRLGGESITYGKIVNYICGLWNVQPKIEKPNWKIIKSREKEARVQYLLD